MHTSPARRQFAHLIRQPDPQVPLAATALAIAWEDQGGPAPQASLERLEALTRMAAERLGPQAGVAARAALLSAFLFREVGFYGDPGCYDHPDPANSHLDRVLERRTGLPIMLALIYLELGWRLGLPVHGVALPGHFIVRVATPEGDLLLDPFRGGATWTMADCTRQIASFYGPPSPELVNVIMAPPGRGAILVRILRNLKQAYLARDDTARALTAVDRLLMLDRSDPTELRDRGLLRARLGQIHAALEDLEQYARQHPAAADLTEVRSLARELAGQVTPRN
ncbi:MAG: SirB1 family protein [Oscillochloridaceae bacterium umkhey_bin13]